MRRSWRSTNNEGGARLHDERVAALGRSISELRLCGASGAGVMIELGEVDASGVAATKKASSLAKDRSSGGESEASGSRSISQDPCPPRAPDRRPATLCTIAEARIVVQGWQGSGRSRWRPKGTDHEVTRVPPLRANRSQYGCCPQDRRWGGRHALVFLGCIANDLLPICCGGV